MMMLSRAMCRRAAGLAAATPKKEIVNAASPRLCRGLASIAVGDVVEVAYTGRISGTQDIVDASGEKPLSFKVGAEEVIPCFHDAVTGKDVGGKLTITAGPAEAYGERMEDYLFEVERSRLPEDVFEGQTLVMETADGSLPVHVSSLNEDGKAATIDANPPLAGLTLDYEIEILNVTPSSEVVEEVEPRASVDEITPGDGKTFPQKGEKVTVHYTGTLATTGEQFDSSRDRGSPFSFVIGVGQVISGWDQAVQQMSKGQRAMLHIPWQLAYPGGAGGIIPPKTDLKFDVELLSIE